MLVVEEKAAIEAASVLFASVGEVLVCAGADGRIVFAPDAMREFRNRTVTEIFGMAVDLAMRGEHREALHTMVQTVRGPRPGVVTVAPFESDEDLGLEGVRYVLAFRAEEVSGEADRIRLALEAHRWRREEAARALGISRATLWRKMREYALL
jgi:transcriptional regulator of acetoin/glycerol metabolism